MRLRVCYKYIHIHIVMMVEYTFMFKAILVLVTMHILMTFLEIISHLPFWSQGMNRKQPETTDLQEDLVNESRLEKHGVRIIIYAISEGHY